MQEYPRFNDPRWRMAAVRPRRRRSTELLPSPGASRGDADIFAGDTVFIIPEWRYEHWVIAKVGHIIGWINTLDVKFIDAGRTQPPPRKPSRQPEVSVSTLKKLIRFFGGS